MLEALEWMSNIRELQVFILTSILSACDAGDLAQVSYSFNHGKKFVAELSTTGRMKGST